VISLASVGLGALIGFLVIVVLGIMFPGVGHLLGALLGGFVVIFSFFGFAFYGGSNYGFLGALVGGIVGTALSIIIGIIATIVSAIGGFIGGAITR
jgi:hypothetical protein